MPSIFDSINLGIQAFNSALPLIQRAQQSGGSSGVNVVAMIDDLVRQLNQLEVGFAALPYAQRIQNGATALQACDAVIQALRQVPVRSGGAGSEYLANVLTVSAAVKNHIQQMIQEAQTGTPTQTTTPVITGNTPTTGTNPTQGTVTPVIGANGQVQYIVVPNNQSQTSLFGNMSNEDLLLIGGAILLVLLIK